MMPANIQSTGLVISWWITVFTGGLSPWGASQITNMQPHITVRAEQPTSKFFKVLAEKIPHTNHGREQPTFQISEGKAVPGMKPASSLKVHPHCKVGHMPCSALKKTWMLFWCLHLNNFIPSVPKLKPLIFHIVFQPVYKVHVIVHLYFNPISPQFPSAVSIYASHNQRSCNPKHEKCKHEKCKHEKEKQRRWRWTLHVCTKMTAKQSAKIDDSGLLAESIPGKFSCCNLFL